MHVRSFVQSTSVRVLESTVVSVWAGFRLTVFARVRVASLSVLTVTRQRSVLVRDACAVRVALQTAVRTRVARIALTVLPNNTVISIVLVNPGT